MSIHSFPFTYTHILCSLQGKAFPWPVSAERDSSASSSIQENEDSGRDSIESRKLPQNRIPRVKFTCDGDSSSSPAESVSSVEYVIVFRQMSRFVFLLFFFFIRFSSSTREARSSMDAMVQQTDLDMFNYQDIFRHVDLCNVSITANENCGDASLSPYRKYIEHVLKSRGLGQSLSFLHHLHNFVVRKAHATLELPGAEEIEMDFDGFEDNISRTEIPLNSEEEEDLHRYGTWSKEAISLNLPSYVPAFVFLSVMPLEVMHEYLRMRLETKPVTPNPLSLEQLMKELREGLILAMTHRERFSKHIHTAFYEKETELEKYMTILESYDATVKKVLEVISRYIEFYFE